jgi:hypothetical protein
MLAPDPNAFDVFALWRDAPVNAFGSKNNPGVISDQDKARYSLIYDELMQAAEVAKLSISNPETIELKAMNYSHQYGSRGHRPVDVWVSLCGAGSEDFARMPQVYMIASERGLELGFAISINEDDYHDPSVKSRNRTIVPLINRKLPNPSDDEAVMLADELEHDGGWFFNTKARLAPGNEGFAAWSSLSEMLDTTKSNGTSKGGGSICKLFPFDQLLDLDLDTTFSHAIQMFYPLLMGCLPDAWENELVLAQVNIEKLEHKVDFDPTNTEDARDKVLRSIAQRRGQSKFRHKLIKAYDGKCAISQTAVEAVLEAAHITPYLGEQTNHITNGILLRTDLHTLFDLNLLKIDPNNMKVRVSPSLQASPYWVYNGRKVSLPKTPQDRPSPLALAEHYKLE